MTLNAVPVFLDTFCRLTYATNAQEGVMGVIQIQLRIAWAALHHSLKLPQFAVAQGLLTKPYHQTFVYQRVHQIV